MLKRFIACVCTVSYTHLQEYEQVLLIGFSIGATIAWRCSENPDCDGAVSYTHLGMGGTNLNAYTGKVNNPWDVTRISGGSSGGSAALVASGVVPMAVGTDTGDSVRKPAAYCGVIGMKPTYGRISRYGIIPYASSLDHVGFFTRCVEDAAITLEVLAGRDDRDLTSSFEPDVYKRQVIRVSNAPLSR